MKNYKFILFLFVTILLSGLVNANAEAQTKNTNLGNPCTKNSQCGPGAQCANGRFCAPIDKTGKPGDYCHHNNHCASNQCVCPRGEGEVFGVNTGFCKEYEKGNNKGHCYKERVPQNWSPGTSKACSEDYVCGKGQICDAGSKGRYRCIPGCRKNTDCGDDQVCFNNECKTPAETRTPGTTSTCYEGPQRTKGVGLCRAGSRYVTNSGEWSGCNNQTLPRQEVCNRLDDDCDGKIDEGITCQCTPGSSRECYSGSRATLGVGECKRGKQFCSGDNKWQGCLGQQLPTPEVKDGKDNDCDGKIDEDPGTKGRTATPMLRPSEPAVNINQEYRIDSLEVIDTNQNPRPVGGEIIIQEPR